MRFGRYLVPETPVFMNFALKDFIFIAVFSYLTTRSICNLS